MAEIPQDMTSLEYARHLLEFDLGWPCKGNLEMIADCLTSVSKAKNLALPRALIYLERAVKLAKAQEVKIDRFFFQNGEYTNIRPSRKDPRDDYKIDREKTKQEQETEEWLIASLRARTRLAEIADGKYLPRRNSKEIIKQQAQELLAKRGQTDRELETKGSTGK